MLAQIGGIYEVLLVSGMLLTLLWSRKLYLAQLIGNLYQITKPVDNP